MLQGISREHWVQGGTLLRSHSTGENGHCHLAHAWRRVTFPRRFVGASYNQRYCLCCKVHCSAHNIQSRGRLSAAPVVSVNVFAPNRNTTASADIAACLGRPLRVRSLSALCAVLCSALFSTAGTTNLPFGFSAFHRYRSGQVLLQWCNTRLCESSLAFPTI